MYYRLRDIAELSYEISTEKLNAKIIECVKCHRQVLNLSNQLENFFAEIIFIKFVISGLLICSLAFRLVRAEGQFYILLYQLVFLTTVSTQLLMYCYSGQRLKDEVSFCFPLFCYIILMINIITTSRVHKWRLKSIQYSNGPICRGIHKNYCCLP